MSTVPSFTSTSRGKASEFFARIARWIYPATCLLCGANGDYPLDLCTACKADLPHNIKHCRQCALPLAGVHDNNAICGQCLKQPPAFDTTFAPYRYGHPIDHLIMDFKYNGKLSMGRTLGLLFAQEITRRNVELPQALLPVPLHPAALNERGFNQSTLLAEMLGKAFTIPVLYEACERDTATQRQSKLDAAGRKRNVRDAFRITQKLNIDHIAVVDDVMTTGATAAELARTLKDAGAKRVDIWCLCRAGY